MGKIVKYCAECEESFAEKFAFCPNCAQPLTAFEMNPVSSGGGDTVLGKQAGQTVLGNNKPPENDDLLEVPATAPIVAKTILIKPVVAEAAPEVEMPTVGDTKIFSDSNKTQAFTLADIEEMEHLDEVKTEEIKADDIAPETKTFAAAAGANVNGSNQTNELRSNLNAAKKSDDGFHITVIEEKNSKQRNGLLLGTLVIMVIVALSSGVYSLFTKDVGIGSIDGDNPVFFVDLNEIPPPEIEEPAPKPEKDDGGGGGGGGNKNPDPVTKGVPPTQVLKPVAPLMMVQKMTNPDIKIVNQTQGTKVRPPTNEQVGLTSGLNSDRLSSGGGSGGGFGNGRGSGAGNGLGTGEGNGNGSGSGNGNGNGNGNGTGDGSGVRPPPPPPAPKPVGPTEAIKILSKPQPRYTDAARQNNVTGTVTLKVTFTASGQIGSVAPVSGLPYGLTEQAIAAAKAIRFEPPKRNGVPYSVSKTISYSFTIY